MAPYNVSPSTDVRLHNYLLLNILTSCTMTFLPLLFAFTIAFVKIVCLAAVVLYISDQ